MKGYIPCLWIGEFNIVKILIPHQNSNRLSFVVVSEVEGGWWKWTNPDCKICMEIQRVKISQHVLEEQVAKVILLHIKT